MDPNTALKRLVEVRDFESLPAEKGRCFICSQVITIGRIKDHVDQKSCYRKLQAFLFELSRSGAPTDEDGYEYEYVTIEERDQVDEAMRDTVGTLKKLAAQLGTNWTNEDGLEKLARKILDKQTVDLRDDVLPFLSQRAGVDDDSWQSKMRQLVTAANLFIPFPISEDGVRIALNHIQSERRMSDFAIQAMLVSGVRDIFS